MLSNTRLEGLDQKEEPQRTVTLSTLEGRISSHFEFTLPSGNISERFEQQFNNLHTVFNLNFNFLNSSVDHSNVLQTSHQLRDRVFVTESFGFNYPIYIWNRDISTYYSLGGFNTIRGYSYGSIVAFRYLLNRFDMGALIFPKAQIKLRVLKRRATIHDSRVFFIFDGLPAQDHLSCDSAVNVYGGCGGGFSFLTSGEKQQHIKVSTYVVQPIEPGRLPIFYFQTSFFNFEKKI